VTDVNHTDIRLCHQAAIVVSFKDFAGGLWQQYGFGQKGKIAKLEAISQESNRI
jgi:hypothetical protein